MLRLRGLAESSQGRYLDLATVSIAEAVKELNLRRGRIVALSGQGAEQLVSESIYPQSGRLRLAGRLPPADRALGCSSRPRRHRA